MQQHASLSDKRTTTGTIVGAVTSIWRNRRLIAQLTVRDVLGRYRGSAGGLLWSLVNPLLMLAVYTFVFSVVFKARWAGAETGSTPEFALLLFAGMSIHAMFAECINKGPGLILANANYVKKVVFPIEILPVVALCSAVFHLAISLLILIATHWFMAGIDFGFLWLVFVLPPFLLLTAGVTWFLAATGVYVRDIGQTTTLLTTLLLFLSPVFYPVSALPERIQPLLQLNPLTFIMEQARAVMIWGQTPDFMGLAIYTVVALLFAAGGLTWFQRTRSGFADVL